MPYSPGMSLRNTDFLYTGMIKKQEYYTSSSLLVGSLLVGSLNGLSSESLLIVFKTQFSRTFPFYVPPSKTRNKNTVIPLTILPLVLQRYKFFIWRIRFTRDHGPLLSAVGHCHLWFRN